MFALPTQISRPSLHQLLYPPPFLELGQTPSAEHLSHVQVMDSRVEDITATTATPPIKPPDHPPLSIGAGLPPVPHKVVAKIQQGEFVDMVELLPDCLGCSFGSTPEDKTTAKPKNQSVTNILEWNKCFGIYMAVIAKSQPNQIPDLLGYQSLIIGRILNMVGMVGLAMTKDFV